MADISESKRVPVTTYPTQDLVDWIDEEAKKTNRNRTRQIEFMLEEYRRMTIWNRKAQSSRSGVEEPESVSELTQDYYGQD